MPAEDAPLFIDLNAKLDEPTNRHRYVVRDIGYLRTARIHQQAWRIESALGVSYEWRDVPVVDEEGATIDTSDIPEAGEDFFAKARMSTPEERIKRVDASLAKQLQQAIENNVSLSQRLEASTKATEILEDQLRELGARLPEGMKNCTILFEECPNGHGSLRATNWVKHPCSTCRIQKQQDALRYVAEGIGIHPANLVAVAKEGLEP